MSESTASTAAATAWDLAASASAQAHAIAADLSEKASQAKATVSDTVRISSQDEQKAETQTSDAATVSPTPADKEGVVEYLVFAEPEERVEDRLRSVVDRLAVDENLDSFEPHVTVWSAKFPESADPEKIASAFEAGIKEWRGTFGQDQPVLRFNMVAFGERRGSFVAVMEETQELLCIHNILRDHISHISQEPFEFIPHLTILRGGTPGSTVVLDLMREGHFAEAEGALIQQDSFTAKKFFLARMLSEETRRAAVVRTYEVV